MSVEIYYDCDVEAFESGIGSPAGVFSRSGCVLYLLLHSPVWNHDAPLTVDHHICASDAQGHSSTNWLSAQDHNIYMWILCVNLDDMKQAHQK